MTNKSKIDKIFNKKSNDLAKNGKYFKLSVEPNGNKFEYSTFCIGINDYSFPSDDIEAPSNTYFFHYFSYEFDDITEQYKKNNNIDKKLDNNIIYQLFKSNKNNLSDLSWIITN